MRDQGDEEGFGDYSSGDHPSIAEILRYKSGDDALRMVLYRMWFHAQDLFKQRFGDGDTVNILMAIGMGRIAGSPVDISSIANITGISRPTVRRRLTALEEEGLVVIERVGNRTIVVSRPEGVAGTQDLARRWAGLVKQAAREIEKLESWT
jgi:DNA-binding transcriptional ArsR family regulator